MDRCDVARARRALEVASRLRGCALRSWHRWATGERSVPADLAAWIRNRVAPVALAPALWSWSLSPATLPEELADAPRIMAAALEGTGGRGLAARLRALSPAAALAIDNALDRPRAAVDAHADEALRAVGIVAGPGGPRSKA